MTSFLRKWWLGSNFLALCGAMFDILRNPKKAVRNMALYRMGSARMSQEIEMLYRVRMLKMPLATGVKFEFIVMLRMYLLTDGCEKADTSQL